MANPNQRGFELGDLTAPIVWGLNTAARVIKGGTPNQPGPGRREALLDAGYTVVETPLKSGVVQQWYRPDGSKLPRDQVNPTARQLIKFDQTVNPPLPPGVLPVAPAIPRAGTQVPPKAPFPPPGYNPVLTPPVPYEPPPPGPRPGTPPINPTGPDFGGAIPWGVFGTFDIVQILKEAVAWRMRYGVIGGLPMPKQPKIPDKPPETFENREMGNPWPPKPPKPYQLPPELRENIYVTPIRMPVSKRLEGYTVAELERMVKAPAPTPAPAAATVPKWMSLVKFGLPALLPLLNSKQGSQRQRQVVNVPDPFGPGTDPRLEPAPSVFFGDVGGRETGGVGSFTCECLPPKKKRRKKKRTVCYSGTYTERADGTRKLKKRKVPCK